MVRERVVPAILAAALLVISLFGITDAQVARTGTIEGQLTNGTSGGGSVVDLKVSLETYVSNNPQGQPLITQADAAGKFQFTGLSTENTLTYVTWVKYGTADYGGDPVIFKEGETSKSVKIQVFEETESDAAITVSNQHSIIESSQGQLFVTEVIRFNNAGDRTYIGTKSDGSDGKRETLRFQLPNDAIGFQPGQGLVESFVTPFEGGFSDSMPLVPGPNDISFIYTIAPGADSYSFSQPLNKYPVSSFSFVVQVDGLEATADQMVKGQPMNIQGRQFVPYSATNLAPGTTVQIQFSGLSKGASSGGGGGGGTVVWIIGIALGCVLASGAVYTVAQKRRPRLAAVKATPSADILDLEKEGLLHEIARLDDEFEAGRLAEGVYKQRRAEKKAQLIELSANLPRNP